MPRPISVVVVDDQQIYLTIAKAVLGGEPDIAVVAVANAAEAGVATVRTHMPDVVLMDQLLPDGKGTDAARRIVSELPDVRVILMTSVADDATVGAAREAGCSGYVTKNRLGQPNVLAEAVRAAARGEFNVPEDALGFFLQAPDA